MRGDVSMHNLAKAIYAMNEVSGSTVNTKFDVNLEKVEQEALKSLAGFFKLASAELAIHLDHGEDPSEWMITPPVTHTRVER